MLPKETSIVTWFLLKKVIKIKKNLSTVVNLLYFNFSPKQLVRIIKIKIFQQL